MSARQLGDFDAAPAGGTLGRYRLLGRIATGGMAELHIARVLGPAGFEQYVAVKRILPHLARDREFVAMFTDEANIAARIRHPNVVSVFELGEQGDELFIVMEYLVGEPLSALIRRMARQGRRVPAHLALHVAVEACKGLQAAHEVRAADGSKLGVVHRDISPQNILVTFDGAVKIVDFGIAKAADRVTKTDTGTFKGKLGYSAPEQFDGRGVDLRSDIFSLGAVLYETLTGMRLFKRKTQAMTLRATLEGSIALPSEAVPELGDVHDAICDRAVALEPAARFQSAEEFRRAIVATGLLAPDGTSLLAAFMKAELADRQALHEELLGQAASGEGIDALPPGDSVELPAAPTTTKRRRRRGDRRSLIIGSLAALGLFSLLALVTWIVQPMITPADDPQGTATVPMEAVSVTSTPEPEVAHDAEMESQPPVTEMTSGSNSEGPVEVSPLRVRLLVQSRPSGARVTLGERVVGRTPLSIEVDSTPARLRVSKSGYVAVRRSLTLGADETVNVTLRQRTSTMAPFRRWP